MPEDKQKAQAEVTRARIVATTIEILFTSGHAAATTVEVAKRARISRGALLHHFPTRAALLIGVAQHIVAEQSRHHREHIVDASAGRQRYHMALDISWEVQRQPAAIALLEIMMASRSDRDLRENFFAVIERGDRIRREAAKLAAGDLGIDDVDTVDDMLLLHVSALRGLAIQLMFGRDPEVVERIRKLFALYERRFAASLADAQKQGTTAA
jgi:AcrR family transcriptional regulator